MKRSKSFTENKPILYLVATPIGNLKDFSPRAIEILSSCDFIACEDTRTSRVLLTRYHIHTPLISCHQHNETTAGHNIINLLKTGLKVAYMSDAGYPAISDPGAILVRLALENDINVAVISGASACLNALVGSGLDCEHFYFHGFLQSREAARINELQTLYKKCETLIFYESPHRISKTLRNMFDVFGNRYACIARELTKKHEEYIRGNLEELLAIDPVTLKGEMVIVVEGNHNESALHYSDDEIVKFVKSLTDIGFSTKDAVAKASLVLKVHKNYIYKLCHRS